ncbi:MAG: hypothetical protein U0271_21785 [Polyangiaceae bacterium]
MKCRSVFWVCALVITAGCGGSVTVNGGGGEGGGGGAGGSTGPCAGYEDEPSTGSVVIRIRNDDFVPVYLPGGCDGLAYGLVSNSGTSATYNFDGSCLQTCEDLQTQPQYECGACAPLAFLLNPGESVEATWTGTGLISDSMPASCFADNLGGTSCSRIIGAANGQYTVSITPYSGCDAGCECDPATHECFGYVGGVEGTMSSATFTFPQATSVDLAIPPCSFGCAGG